MVLFYLYVIFIHALFICEHMSPILIYTHTSCMFSLLCFQMKKMGIHPDGHTYTCLFNCCSNSPWPNDGLQRTRNLHQLIQDKNVLHPITFKAIIKAYGVCGDIQAAFQTADEMCKLHPPDQQFFSFLLMACVSDTKMGLKHAIQVCSNHDFFSFLFS